MHILRGLLWVMLPSLAILSGCGATPQTYPSLAERDTTAALERPHVTEEGTVSHEARGKRAHATHTPRSTKAIDLKSIPELDEIIPKLADKRVVYIGEIHDRFSHHLNQLEIIRGLHAMHPDLAIGMEYFQQPFQQYLDDYIAGRLDDTGLLEKTEYFDRWRFDYRLYQPILAYARAQGIPLVALNVSREIVQKVSNGGFENLTEEDWATVPRDIDRSDNRYRAHLRSVFEQHPGAEEKEFERFVDVQLLWDEAMAEQAARHLQRHEGRYMVVLAGNGHLAYGAGIPRRLNRRISVDSVILLNGIENGIDPDIADYLLLPPERPLPPPGRLGVVLDTSEEGVWIDDFSQGSAAQSAGMERGDRIIVLDGRPVKKMSDIKIAMWRKAPGDRLSVQALRKGWFFGEKRYHFEVQLR